jgi:hypothetical protein
MNVPADDPPKARAMTVLKLLVRKSASAEGDWNGLGNQNQTVSTTLSKLGVDRAADLIYHGYVLAMASAHIHREWPLVPDDQWSLDRFRAFVRKAEEPAKQQ